MVCLSSLHLLGTYLFKRKAENEINIIMAKLYIISGISELPVVANIIINCLGSRNVILLKSNLGGGKTTLTRHIGKFLKSPSHISSPSFSLVNEYESPIYNKIYHFDFYRIRQHSELEDIGFESYMSPKNLCIIEWPGIVLNDIQFPYIEVEIEDYFSSRTYTIKYS